MRKKLIYNLVFNFGYDECEIITLSNKELTNLLVSLMIAERTAVFNGHKPVKLPAGRLNGNNY